MILVRFKNLDASEMAREAATERVEAIVEKFPKLSGSKIQIVLEMVNSPTQAGLDVFKVKLLVAGGSYDGAIVEKANSNLYIALAEVVEHLLEKLNRAGDRTRVRQRNQARQLSQLGEKIGS